MRMKIYVDPRADKIMKTLSKEDGAIVAKVVDLFQDYNYNLTEQHLKKLTKNLWELRAGRWRLLFGLVGGCTVIANILLKKTQKTPKKEIDLAIKRLKEYL